MSASRGLRRLLMFVAVVSLLVPAYAWAQAQASLTGRVVDELNENQPLPGVLVAIEGTNLTAFTNRDGRFTIAGVPPGTYRVSFELSGYFARTLDDVTITSGQATDLIVDMRMGFSTEITVTARRDVSRLQDVPQNVDVVTSQELQATAAVNLVTALNNQVIGFDADTGSANTGVGTFLSINGYDDIYIRKMIDGVDIGEVVTNWSMLNTYPVELLEQVEVVKGGSSAAWGSNMAGIVNLVTKRPRNLRRPVFNLQSTFARYGEMDFGAGDAIPDSGDLQRYSANVMGTYRDLYYLAGYKHDLFDGFTDFGDENNYSAFGKFGYRFDDRNDLDVLYNYNNLSQQIHAFLSTGLPPGLFLWHYRSEVDAYSQVLSVKHTSVLDPQLTLQSQFKFNNWSYDGVTENFPDGVSSPPGTTMNHFTDRKVGFTVQSTFEPEAQPSMSLVSGVDYYRIRADFSFIPNQPIIDVDSWAPFVNWDYGVGDIGAGDLGINAGLRWDYDNSFGDQLSPSVGMNLRFLPSTIFRANVARTFRVPPLWYTLGESFFDLILPNPDLKPERAWAFGIGVESQELRYVWFKLSLYHHEMTDGIVRVPDVQPGRFTWGNTDEFERRGYEAEIGFVTGVGLSGYLANNYNDHTNESGGEVVVWIPTRTWKTGLKYENPVWDFLASLRGRYIWWNHSQRLEELFIPEDEKWLFDLRVEKGFELKPTIRLAVFADIFNLTNQLYWNRRDLPNPRRWADFGVAVNVR